MKSEIIHYGNNNIKRKYSSCGKLKDDSNSVDISKITCINCIDRILHGQYSRNRYTALWENRIKQLREKL
jgi:hypothetical protein